MTRHFKYFVIGSAVMAVIVVIFPGIDMQVSALFYDSQQGFFLNQHPVLEAIHNSVRYVAYAIVVSLVVLAVLNKLNKSPIPILDNRALLYLFLVLALGPGLVVNTIFKDQWGRARPYQTELFGGSKQFTPAFVMTDQCKRNCSFTSGDPSVGFYFFALALVLKRWKKPLMALAFGLGGVFGVTRLIQGAHFFSDVIFSGVFVYLVAYGLYLLMFKTKTERADSPMPE